MGKTNVPIASTSYLVIYTVLNRTNTSLPRRESHLDNAPEGTEGRQLQGRKRLLSPPPHTMSTGTSSRSSNAGEGPVPRRAHSVMALMDFERLVDDEHAASK